MAAVTAPKAASPPMITVEAQALPLSVGPVADGGEEPVGEADADSEVRCVGEGLGVGAEELAEVDRTTKP